MFEILQTRYSEYFDETLYNQLNDTDNLKQVYKCLTENLFNDDEKRKQWAAVILKLANERELMRMHSALQTLTHSSTEGLIQLAQQLTILIPNKVRKKGHTAMVSQIMSKYHKPRVEEAIRNISKFIYFRRMPYLEQKELDVEKAYFETVASIAQDVFKQKDIDKNVEECALEELESYLESTSMLFMYMAARDMEQDALAEYILSRFQEEHWAEYEMTLVHTYVLKRHHEAKLNDNTHQFDIQMVMKEKERLKKQLAKKEKQQHQLQKELYLKQLNEKELKSEIHELHRQLQQQLDTALAEISRLEKEKEQMVAEHKEQIYKYKNIILNLERIIEENQYVRTNYLPLEGCTICVLGHPRRKAEYKEVVEKYGGVYEFFPSNDETNLAGMVGPVRRADAILYLTTCSRHTVLDKLKAVADMSKVHYLNAGGIDSFEHELLTSVIPKLANAKKVGV